MIDETIDGDGEHTAPLHADTIPDANQAHFCFSCSSPMQAVYCGNCGQRNDDFRRSIFALIKETLGTIFGLESRIWRTWAALLFKPGKVAREYSDGRRVAWSSPVRVYLAMSIILFGFMGCTGTQIFSVDVNATLKEGVQKSSELAVRGDIDLHVDVIYFDTKAAIRARNELKDFTLIETRLDLNRDPNGAIETSSDASDTPPDHAEEYNLSFDDGIIQISGNDDNHFNVNDVTLDNFALKVLRSPELLNRSLFTYLPRIMFFMMPLSMLLGAVFIRGKRALLYDHLVHSAYIHAVTFLLIFIGILVSKIYPSPLIAISICLIIIVYLPISLKAMFGRGWPKTLLASYGVGLTYLLVIMSIMVCTVTYDIITQISNSA